MTDYLSLLLAALMALGSALGAGSAEAAVSEDAAPTPAAHEEVVSEAADASHLVRRDTASEPDMSDIGYVHYDDEAFLHDADLLAELARGGDTEGVIGLYDRLYDEYLYIDSLTVLAMVRYYEDFYDEYWTDEFGYMNNVWSETYDALLIACSEVLDSPCARAFAAHIGPETAAYYRSYRAADADELEATARQLALADKYYALYDTMYDISISYEGRTWTLDDLNGFSGNALYYRNYDGYYTVYNGLQQELSEVFAPLYIELVGIWTEEARSAGYDDYIDFAYQNIYARDYTPEDAQRLCDAVKPIAREYYADLYYSDLYYEADAVRPDFTGEELVALLGEYLPRIDESLLAPWQDMKERGLYDVASASSGRYGGSYTTTMAMWHAPYLFATLEDNCYDLTTLTHEFGHYCDYWLNPQTNILTQTDNLDLSEIHSNALQALFTNFYGEIYTRGAKTAEFINLADLLENIIDGCLYDEFQRRVLAEPDGLTAERINGIYIDVCTEYGLYEPGDYEWDSGWVYITHNFERPLYYISYAVSGAAALQIWDLSQTDPDAAAAVYLDILDRGSYDDGYLSVLKSAGLRLFTEEGAVDDICRPVLDRMEELDRNW